MEKNLDSITQWGASATDITEKSTWGQEDYLDSQFKDMYDSFVVQGYPVVIGEFGSIDRTAADSNNNTYRAAFAKSVCKLPRSTVPFLLFGITEFTDKPWFWII